MLLSAINILGRICSFVHQLYDVAKLIRAFLGAFEKLRKATLNFICLPLRVKQLSWMDFHEILHLGFFFFENLSRHLKFHYTLARKTVTLRNDMCTFMIISRSLLLRT